MNGVALRQSLVLDHAPAYEQRDVVVIGGHKGAAPTQAFKGGKLSLPEPEHHRAAELVDRALNVIRRDRVGPCDEGLLHRAPRQLEEVA
jgi:hypothetical protein